MTHAMRCLLVGGAVLVGLPRPAPATGPEIPEALARELHQLEELRDGRKTPFDKVEAQAAELFTRYPDRREQGHIYYQLAHIYAQSGVQHPDRITRYAREALVRLDDPVKRGMLYSYLSSAAEVDKSNPKFEERRRLAAQACLDGLKEILRIDLLESPPEIPPLQKGLGREGFKDSEVKKKYQEQVAARERAKSQREMIDLRDMLGQQVVWLYARPPFMTDEALLIGDNYSSPSATIRTPHASVPGDN